MDSSNGDLDQFIPADGEASKNRKAASDKKKNRQNELTTKCVYDGVTVAVDPEPSNCARVLCSRPCKIAVVVLLLLALLIFVGVLILRFAFKLSPVSSNFVQSSFSNSTNSSRIVPLGKGRPYWSTCTDSDASNPLAEVHAVHTKDCDMVNKRCSVKKDSEGTLEIIFTPKQTLQSPIMKARGCAFFCLWREPTQPDACKDSNLDCPLKANEQYMYRSMEKASVPFPVYTELNVDSQLWMYDRVDGQEVFVFCIVIPVRVVP